MFLASTIKAGIDMTKLLDTLLNFYDWINQAIIKLKKGPVQKVKRGEEKTEKEMWEEEKRVSLEETRNIKKWMEESDE